MPTHPTLREIVSNIVGYDIASRPMRTRSANIIRTYQRLINNLRPDDRAKRQHLISRCLGDLARANHNDGCPQRTEIRI